MFVRLMLFFTRILLRALNLRKWIEEQPDKAFTKSSASPEITQYLKDTVCQLVGDWLTEAKSKTDLDASVSFYSHLALLHEFFGNNAEFLYWHAVPSYLSNVN